MIIEMKKENNQELMDYLSKESAFNLFIIGDIENFGYDSDFQKIWADKDTSSGFFKAVLLKYYKSFIFYSTGEADFENFAKIALREGYDVISGKEESIAKLEPFLSEIKRKETHFAELKKCNFDDIKETVKKAEVKDLDEILKVRNSIEEFGDIPTNAEAFKKSIESGSGRIYYVKRDDKIVSVAGTTAENSMSAMVVGVCTLKEYRKQGIMTECMKSLCSDVIADGKTLCLFYDNPEAGKIYIKIGFEEIGKWIMLINKNN